MKKLFLLVFTAVVTISCSSNSEEEAQDITLTNSNLIGSWKVTSFSENQVAESTINGQFTSETSETLGQDFTLKYLFSQNPNKISSTGIYTGYTRLENGTVVQTNFNSITGIQSNSNWTVNNNIITLTNPDFNQNITVESFDGDILKLKFIHIMEDADIIGGNTFKWTFTSNLTLEKE